MDDETPRDGTSEAIGPTAPPGASAPPTARKPPREIGGPAGPEPTRYGDWERKGRCCDF